MRYMVFSPPLNLVSHSKKITNQKTNVISLQKQKED
jgi:hypothetical protein